jgi:hypothetical protein
VNFEYNQIIVFKNKIILLRAYIKSGLYEIDFVTNKTLVISFLVIASNFESYTQRTLQKETAYKRIL